MNDFKETYRKKSLFWMILLVLFLPMAMKSSYALPLSSWYPMNETSNDYGTLGDNLELVGGISQSNNSAPCIFDGCYVLDGAGDYLKDTTRLSGNGSLCMWFNATTFGAADTLAHTTSPTQWYCQQSGGSSIFCDFPSNDVTLSTVVVVNKNQFICWVQAGTNLMVFLDNQNLGNATNANMKLLGTNMNFGCDSGGSTCMEGALDDISYWANYTLTNDDIAYLWNNGTGHSAKSLNLSSVPSSLNITNITIQDINGIFLKNYVLQENEPYYIGVNYTSNNISVTGASCNMTLLNATSVTARYNTTNFSMNTGNENLSLNFTENSSGLKNDRYEFRVCHPSASSSNVEVWVNGVNVETVPSSTIPSCSAGYHEQDNITSAFISSSSINYSLRCPSCNGVLNTIRFILGNDSSVTSYSRIYNIHQESTSYNSTTKIYENRAHPYSYAMDNPGNITVQCSLTDNATRNLTITNLPLQVMISELNNMPFINGMTILRKAVNNITADTRNDILSSISWNISYSNGTLVKQQDNASIITLSSADLSVNGFYNISVTAVDDETAETNVKGYFNVTGGTEMTYPANNTFNNDTTINATFISNFDAKNCTLFSNITTGVMHEIGSVSASASGIAPIAWWRYEEGTGNWTADSSGYGNNGAIQSPVWTSSKGGNNTGTAAQNFQGINGQNTSVNASDSIRGRLNMTFTMWIKPYTVATAYEALIQKFSGTTTTYMILLHANLLEFQWSGDNIAVSSVDSTGLPLVAGIWQFIAVEYNYINNSLMFYVNGSAEFKNALGTSMYSGTGSYLTHGIFQQTDAYPYKGDMDEVRIYNITLSISQLNELYNTGTIAGSSGTFPAFTVLNILHTPPINTVEDIKYIVSCYDASDARHDSSNVTIHYFNDYTAPAITVISPNITANNSHFNTDIPINLTTDEPASCTLNDTRWSLQYSNASMFRYNSSNLSSGYYDVLISCSDMINNSATARLNFTIDKVMPLITWNTPDFYNTSGYDYNQSFFLNIQFYDRFMFAYNISVYDVTAALRYNFTKTGITSSNVILITQLVADLPGTWTIIAEAYDSHTAQEIPDYAVVTESNKLIYSFGEEQESNITIEYVGQDAVTGVQTEKRFDRYDFRYEFAVNPSDAEIHVGKDILNYEEAAKAGIDMEISKPMLHQSYRVKCEGISKIANSTYPGHVVCWNTKTWADFSTPGISDVKMTRCGSGCYQVDFDVPYGDETIFNSIGGLNRYAEAVTFNVSTTLYSAPASSANTTLLIMTCPTSIQSQMALWLAALLIVAFIVIALAWKIIGLGMIASVGLFAISWTIVGCSGLIGYIVALTGVVMFITFAVMAKNA